MKDASVATTSNKEPRLTSRDTPWEMGSVEALGERMI